MRTGLFLLAGLPIAAACLILGKLFSVASPDAARWLGVAKAGYSIGDELPIFLLIFAVPAAAAILVKWQLL